MVKTETAVKVHIGQLWKEIEKRKDKIKEEMKVGGKKRGR
jgi:hypothetical protein